MTEYWQRTVVRGVDDDKKDHVEIVLHRREEDPMVMAFRRNRELSLCNRIEEKTYEAFMQIRKDAEGSRRRKDISRDDRQGDKFEW